MAGFEGFLELAPPEKGPVLAVGSIHFSGSTEWGQVRLAFPPGTQGQVKVIKFLCRCQGFSYSPVHFWAKSLKAKGLFLRTSSLLLPASLIRNCAIQLDLHGKHNLSLYTDGS